MVAFEPLRAAGHDCIIDSRHPPFLFSTPFLASIGIGSLKQRHPRFANGISPHFLSHPCKYSGSGKRRAGDNPHHKSRDSRGLVKPAMAAITAPPSCLGRRGHSHLSGMEPPSHVLRIADRSMGIGPVYTARIETNWISKAFSRTG